MIHKNTIPERKYILKVEVLVLEKEVEIKIIVG